MAMSNQTITVSVTLDETWERIERKLADVSEALKNERCVESDGAIALAATAAMAAASTRKVSRRSLLGLFRRRP